MIPAVIPLLLVVAGGAALLAGAATLRSLGRGYRIGRLLATVPRASVADAIRVAEQGPRRYLAIEGRIDSEESFEDAHQRPLVLRRTRLEARAGREWRRIEDSLEAVPFEVRDGLEGIAVDTAALGDGLVVMPRESIGVVGDLAERAPDGFPPDAPARARIDQVSSVEHATVLGWPTLDPHGKPIMTAGVGRPLILSVLEPDEAMRVLARGERLRPRVAALLFALGLGLGAIGLAWAGIEVLGIADVPLALAATPGAAASASPPAASGSLATGPAASALAGDTRSSGEGPGLVGTPGLAIAGVILVGVVAAGATLLYVRVTGGPRRP
jgi:hypothetical protein